VKINVIIPASGVSSRYGKNKLFEKVGDSVVVVEAIKPFLEIDEVSRIVIAVNSSFSDELFAALDYYKIFTNKIVVTHGGNSRSETVHKALIALEDDCDFVMVHDGARPFIKKELIVKVLNAAIEHGAAVPVIPLIDSIIRAEGFPSSLHRHDFRLVQTPQCFKYCELKKAYSMREGDYSDDLSVYEKYLKKAAALVDGDPSNIKITTARDLGQTFSGVGYDIHKLKEGNGIKLCGVFIPFGKSFEAHSDGDVAIHALMDALLSSAGLKDIGHLFPNTDPAYKGADSAILLKRVLDIVKEKGFKIINASLTIIAEKPMLYPYIDEMKLNLSKLLCVPMSKIGITATTNEGVGRIGDGEAIASIATVSTVNYD